MTAQSYSAIGDAEPLSAVFKPAPDRSRWEGLAAVAWIGLIDLALVLWLTRRPVDSLSFLLLVAVMLTLPPLVHLSIRTWRAFTLEYWVDRDALRIRCGPELILVPLGSIEQIVANAAVPLPRSVRFWPAPFIRSIAGQDGREDGRAEMFATLPPEQSIWLLTEQTDFMLSPADREGFLAALQAHHRLGVAHTLGPGHTGWGRALARLRTDRLTLYLLGAGLCGVLLLFAIFFIAYPGLPERLVFHYDASGAPDSIRPKSALLLLPGIAVTAYLVNGLAGLWLMLRRQPTGAYLLWGSTLGVQLLSLFALVSLIR